MRMSSSCKTPLSPSHSPLHCGHPCFEHGTRWVLCGVSSVAHLPSDCSPHPLQQPLLIREPKSASVCQHGQSHPPPLRCDRDCGMAATIFPLPRHSRGEEGRWKRREKERESLACRTQPRLEEPKEQPLGPAPRLHWHHPGSASQTLSISFPCSGSVLTVQPCQSPSWSAGVVLGLATCS